MATGVRPQNELPEQAAGCRTPGNDGEKQKVLVTGGTGYLGRASVSALSSAGYLVRVLARPTSDTLSCREQGAEICLGDVRSLSDVRHAMQGVHHVVHLAAGLAGTAAVMVGTSVEGTHNVADAARSCGVQRVVHISSFSVYDYAHLRPGDLIGEGTLLDANPDGLGPYAKGKRIAEEIARAQFGQPGPRWTILRPSVLVGKGRDLVGRIGKRLGPVVIAPGTRRRHLLLVHVEDAASAIVDVLQSDQTCNSIFTISSPETIVVEDYVRRCLTPSRAAIVYIPYWMALIGFAPLAWITKIVGGSVNVSNSLPYLYRDVGAGESRLSQVTRWRPTPLLDRLADEQRGIS